MRYDKEEEKGMGFDLIWELTSQRFEMVIGGIIS